MKLRITYSLLLPCLFLLTACAGVNVSFNGGTIPPEVKTVSIQTFTADVPAGPANLGLRFTEKLREYYQRNSRLAVIPDNGDFMLEGSIVGYDVAPVAPQSGGGGNGQLGQIAGQQRLTVSIKLQFTNTKQPDKDFETTFSNFVDFPAGQNLSQVENDLLEEIFNRIILEVFNKTAGDW